MAKKSMIARETKRAKQVAKYAEKRAALKAIISNPESDFDDRMEKQNRSIYYPSYYLFYFFLYII